MPQIGEHGLKQLCGDTEHNDPNIFVPAEYGVGQISTKLLDNEQKKDRGKMGKMMKWFDTMKPFFRGLLQLLKLVSTVSNSRFSFADKSVGNGFRIGRDGSKRFPRNIGRIPHCSIVADIRSQTLNQQWRKDISSS